MGVQPRPRPWNFPGGLALDTAGNLYIPDLKAGRIRKIDKDGDDQHRRRDRDRWLEWQRRGRYRRTGHCGPGRHRAGRSACTSTTTTTSGTIGTDGIIRAFAGTGVAGLTPVMVVGPSTLRSREVNGATADAEGNVYLGDSDGHRIRKVDPSGTITTVAGTGQSGDSGDGGPAIEATFGYPGALVWDPAGNLYVADWVANVVRKIDAEGHHLDRRWNRHLRIRRGLRTGHVRRAVQAVGPGVPRWRVVHRRRRQLPDPHGRPVAIGRGRPTIGGRLRLNFGPRGKHDTPGLGRPGGR